ncbi:Inosine-uridine preferring nucleoside hydrolase [Monaibacterium marinum]|uniref:Inosine-uridine preferring nucleoside hydrolase n=1 Tax=Pontivivens marinum TaxID=1690039 RepID=A0A2C9CLG5_9RHOB|nr:nucleoside hydrolase [Monaibacterium marinum]SOH92186.1 Inosine-uridine preferring nucleoside hydrolase [Monaibacterium marinum]
MTSLKDIAARFPTLDADLMRSRLARPAAGARVIIDTDTANEIDDQYALAWALLSPERVNVIGVTAVPFSFQHHKEGLIKSVEILQNGGPQNDVEEKFMGGLGGWAQRIVDAGRTGHDVKFVTPEQGVELSYQEILTIYDKCGVASEGKVFRGSPAYLSDYDTPIESDSTRFIIEQARNRADGPVYILAMGALTNIASALLLAPDIIDNIVVIWTASFPSYAPFCNEPSLNLVQDRLASRLLFECGVPHVYLPGYHVGAQLSISHPEMEQFVKPKGAIGAYLWHLYTNNPLHEMFAITQPETKTWVIWDIINVAWLFDEKYVSMHMTTSPALNEKLYWETDPSRHLMAEAYDLDRDAIFEDLFETLSRAPGL